MKLGDYFHINSSGVVGQSEKEYEADVNEMLQTIAGTRTGEAILYKIVSHGMVLITPVDEDDMKHCNASAHRNRLGDDSFIGELIGDIVGSVPVVRLEYTPATYAEGSDCRLNSGPGFMPDDVLLHELVHAARSLGNDRNSYPLTGKLKNYDTNEEFHAVLVANIYSAEQGRQILGPAGIRHSNLRADHRLNGKHLQAPYTDSDVFLSVPEHYKLIDEFCTAHTTIGPMIAKGSGSFNPIRSYYNFLARQKTG